MPVRPYLQRCLLHVLTILIDGQTVFPQLPTTAMLLFSHIFEELHLLRSLMGLSSRPFLCPLSQFIPALNAYQSPAFAVLPYHHGTPHLGRFAELATSEYPRCRTTVQITTSSSASFIVQSRKASDYLHSCDSSTSQSKPIAPPDDVASNRPTAFLCSSTSLHNAVRVVHWGS